MSVTSKMDGNTLAVEVFQRQYSAKTRKGNVLWEKDFLM
jgi:hypothetical protein